MKFILRLVLISVSLIISMQVLAAEKSSKVTYRWKDDNGIVQYTERPPANRSYEKITVTTAGGEEVEQVSAEQATQAATDGAVSPEDEVTKANERNCKIAQQNMTVLKNIARIRVTENGQERILTPEEKKKREEDTQKQIDTFCKSPE